MSAATADRRTLAAVIVAIKAQSMTPETEELVSSADVQSILTRLTMTPGTRTPKAKGPVVIPTVDSKGKAISNRKVLSLLRSWLGAARYSPEAHERYDALITEYQSIVEQEAEDERAARATRKAEAQAARKVAATPEPDPVPAAESAQPETTVEVPPAPVVMAALAQAPKRSRKVAAAVA